NRARFRIGIGGRPVTHNAHGGGRTIEGAVASYLCPPPTVIGSPIPTTIDKEFPVLSATGPGRTKIASPQGSHIADAKGLWCYDASLVFLADPILVELVVGVGKEDRENYVVAVGNSIARLTGAKILDAAYTKRGDVEESYAPARILVQLSV